jgi:hypothetical protein
MALAGGGTAPQLNDSAVAGGDVHQMQPLAAPETSICVPQITVVSWKYLMIESVKHVEWTVKCEGMKDNKFPDLRLYCGQTFLGSLLNIPCIDSQHTVTFRAKVDQNHVDQNRHELRFWCVATAL